MLYTCARFILFLLFKIFFRMRIYGRKNFPKSGAVIVAPNHVSFFDPLIAGVGAPRKLNFLARDNLFRVRPFGRILYAVNAHPIKREGGDINAFKIALSRLEKGEAVLIFPEGTRSRDGNLQEAKSGIGFLQRSSGAAVLPCYIKGSQEAWPRHSRFPRPSRISVHFGKPLVFEEISSDKKKQYAYVSQGVMAAIGELKNNAD